MRQRLRNAAAWTAVWGLMGAAIWLLVRGSEAEESPLAPVIARLGDEDYAVREAAGSELLQRGESALPPLREAAVHSPDLETRLRARQLVSAILLSICKSKSTGLSMAVVEAGSATIGAPLGEGGRRDDETPHRVRITSTFLLGQYEVTQDQYEKVMQNNPSWFGPQGPGKEKIPGPSLGRLPVERVSWFDAVEFCNRLSELDGLKPYYVIEDVRREGNSIRAARVKIAGGGGFRLPTEAEWEFACRAGTDTPFHFGGGSNGEKANVKGQTYTGYGGRTVGPDLQRTCEVGNYEPSALGLFDMHGNVAEWCWDWYDKDYYAASPGDDPPGPDDGQQRVLRGGSWLLHESSSRSASRGFQTPDEVKEFAGFRVARTP